MNMKVNIAGVEWNNPVTVASGTFGSGAEFAEFADLNRIGAVTTKGVANIPWAGNPTPRVAETYGGMMNAVGLQNPGIDLFCERDIPFLRKYDTKIIVNAVSYTHLDVYKRQAFYRLPRTASGSGADHADRRQRRGESGSRGVASGERPGRFFPETTDFDVPGDIQ